MVKKYSYFIIFFFFIVNISFVLAVECGAVPVSGCEVSQNTTFENGIYYLLSRIRMTNSGVVLDCNGATLIGSKNMDGIIMPGVSNSFVRNCIFQNFSTGLHMMYSGSCASIIYPDSFNIIKDNIFINNSFAIKSVGASCYGKPYYNLGNEISGNFIRENDKGIELQKTELINITENVFQENKNNGIYFSFETYRNKIYNNDFINNTDFGIYLSVYAFDNIIYNNTFDTTGIRYDATNDNKYCLDGKFPNIYFGDVKGPSCDCLPLLNKLFITTDEIICYDNYNFLNGIKVTGDNLVLDCNNSTLIGSKKGGIGIDLRGTDNSVLINCTIQNYSKGVRFIYEHGCGTGLDKSEFNIIQNNILRNNTVAIQSVGGTCSLIKHYNSDNKIIDNFIYDNEYGMEIQKTKLTNITQNFLQDNYRGVYFTSTAEENTAYHNNFINSLSQSDNYENNLNISRQGNYWSEYDTRVEGCYDTNYDFICDEPYSISGLAKDKDYFPFSVIDGWLNNCNGYVQVIVEDSDNQGIQGMKVLLNDELQGLSDSFGVLDMKIIEDDCSVQQSVEIRCSDDSFCGKVNTSIDFSGESDSVMFNCELCFGEADLFIFQQDVVINSIENMSVVNVTVHSVNLEADNLTVRFQTIGKDGLIKDSFDKVVDISVNSEAFASAEFDLNDIEFIIVYVDPEAKFQESKINNFVQKSAMKKIKANLDISTGVMKVDEAILEFLEVFVEPVSLENADIVIAVGRFSENIVEDVVDKQEFIDDYSWGFKDEKVFAGGMFLEIPYNGIAGAYEKSGKQVIVLLGAGIDGTIASVKKMTGASGIYLNKGVENKPLIILDDFDLTALGVYDILHNEENERYYMKDVEGFKIAVEKTLKGNTFDVAIRRVNTTGANPVTLRIKNINSEFSEEYKDAVINNPMPVIMSGGLWSDLFRWEKFGKELASLGRNVWLIEITGGPLIEREEDYNYDYWDLVDKHWPASIAAVQYFTKEDSVQYVGNSNGCRVALSSLEKYQETGLEDVGVVWDSSNGELVMVDLVGGDVVDTFVGTGCPGAFDGTSFVVEKVRGRNDSVERLKEMGLEHVTLKEVAMPIDAFFGTLFTFSKGQISLNLWSFYNNLIISDGDSQPGQNLNINKAHFIYGIGGINSIGNEQDDSVVPANDIIAITNNINSSNLDKLSSYKRNHKFLPGSKQVDEKIKEVLNNG